jgi:hypothetical protein
MTQKGTGQALAEAYEYVMQAIESEGEQRAEFGMGAASMGFDPNEFMPAYDGYRTSEDPDFQAAQRLLASEGRAVHDNPIVVYGPDDLPF